MDEVCVDSMQLARPRLSIIKFLLLIVDNILQLLRTQMLWQLILVPGGFFQPRVVGARQVERALSGLKSSLAGLRSLDLQSFLSRSKLRHVSLSWQG